MVTVGAFFGVMVQQRSANSTHIQWVKGHVTLQQLGQGFPVRDAVSNSHADAAANVAHTASSLHLHHEILEFFGRKHQDLVRILVAIFKRIARVAKAANEKLEAIAKDNAIVDIEAPIFAYSDRSCSAVGLRFVNAVPLTMRRRCPWPWCACCHSTPWHVGLTSERRQHLHKCAKRNFVVFN